MLSDLIIISKMLCSHVHDLIISKIIKIVICSFYNVLCACKRNVLHTDTIYSIFPPYKISSCPSIKHPNIWTKTCLPHPILHRPIHLISTEQSLSASEPVTTVRQLISIGSPLMVIHISWIIDRRGSYKLM